MAKLNYLCEHDISDEDCYKCSVYGIVWPEACIGCEDFKDMRNRMSEPMLRQREKYMEMLGLTIDFKTPCWQCRYRRNGVFVNLESPYAGSERENMDTCMKWESKDE